MKKGMDYLEPFLKKTTVANKGKVILATVQGDIHDIGKNIVGVVLACNNFEIIDMGVMVPYEKIIQTAVKKTVDEYGENLRLLGKE